MHLDIIKALNDTANFFIDILNILLGIIIGWKLKYYFEEFIKLHYTKNKN